MNFIEYQTRCKAEDARHQKAIAKLQVELKKYQTNCKHDAKLVYYPDPSGNNDSWYECPLCGAQL